MAVLRGDALGVELDAVHGIALVLEAHDYAVARLRRDLEHRGQGCAIDDQRMIASCSEVLRDAGKNSLAGVMQLGQLAVHQRGRPDHAAAIDLADGLMTEADAKDRHLGPGPGNEFETDAGPVGIAWAGRSTIAAGRSASTWSTVTLSLR